MLNLNTHVPAESIMKNHSDSLKYQTSFSPKKKYISTVIYLIGDWRPLKG